MPTVKVGDISMCYEVHGKGAPLVLIAGWTSDMTAWQLQIPGFSAKYQVVVFDNRGAGRTDAPDIPYSIRMMADDTIGLMDALHIDRAHILGLSMGGYIAQEVAINYRERTRSLILSATSAAPATYSYLSGYHVVRAWAAAMTEVSPRMFARMTLPYVFTNEFLEKPEMVAMAVETMAANPYPSQSYACNRQLDACYAHDSRSRLNQVAAPTLVMVGKADILLPAKMSEDLAALIPGARLTVLEGGGHGFNFEIADRFNRAVLEFLAQVD